MTYEDLRHFMAHGLMVVSTRETATEPMYRKAGKAEEEYGTIETDPDQLAEAAHEISEYTRQNCDRYRTDFSRAFA